MSATAGMPVSIRVEATSFEAGLELSRFEAQVEAGAVASFTGICRSEGGRLAALELEHYPGMVEAELERLVSEAAARWPLSGVTVIHRHGRIAAGEPIVFVAAAADHRAEAFAAAEFLMDWLKTSAPFWKREIASDGTAGDWVEARHSDDRAAARWSRKAAE